MPTLNWIGKEAVVNHHLQVPFRRPSFDGQKVIYCPGRPLGHDRLQAERIIVRQTPYEIKVS